MPDQFGFAFDAGLDVSNEPSAPKRLKPEPVAAPAVLPTDKEAFTSCLVKVLGNLPDDCGCDDPLLLIGMAPESIVNWYRSRAMDAFLRSGDWQSYQPEPGKVRFRRIQR